MKWIKNIFKWFGVAFIGAWIKEWDALLHSCRSYFMYFTTFHIMEFGRNNRNEKWPEYNGTCNCNMYNTAQSKQFLHSDIPFNLVVKRKVYILFLIYRVGLGFFYKQKNPLYHLTRVQTIPHCSFKQLVVHNLKVCTYLNQYF